MKLIAKSQEELQKEIQTVKTFSDDMHMEFGLEKCAKIAFKRGKLVHSQNLVIDINREIQELEQGKMYKYLGIEESEGIQYQRMKDRLKQEYSITLYVFLCSVLLPVLGMLILCALLSPQIVGKVCICYLSLCSIFLLHNILFITLGLMLPLFHFQFLLLRLPLMARGMCLLH